MSELSVTLIQTSLFWEDRDANLKMLEEKIMGIREKTMVVVLPEMFSTGFSMKPEELAEEMDGPAVLWMKKVAARKKLIITGSLIIRDKGNYFNRLLWVLPTGQFGFYDKRHLFGYAGEDRHYKAGHERLVASVNGWRINLMVCYDLRFPVWARQQRNKNGDPEYDVLVYVANWPEKRNTAWKTLLRARAIENQCYVIGVNRVGKDGNEIYHSGDSTVIDPLGEIIHTMEHSENIFTINLKKDELVHIRERFPFLKDADDFNILP